MPIRLQHDRQSLAIMGRLRLSISKQSLFAIAVSMGFATMTLLSVGFYSLTAKYSPHPIAAATTDSAHQVRDSTDRNGA